MTSLLLVMALKAILRIFEFVPELKVNFSKSKYLGLPIDENPRTQRCWQPVIDTIKKRLSSWKDKNLFMEG
ncbi:hypothetical protein Lal_00031639 [Lupinus albus]|nr:hypothetical protein Lal_00031639 [Lupinus albus]